MTAISRQLIERGPEGLSDACNAARVLAHDLYPDSSADAATASFGIRWLLHEAMSGYGVYASSKVERLRMLEDDSVEDWVAAQGVSYVLAATSLRGLVGALDG